MRWIDAHKRKPFRSETIINGIIESDPVIVIGKTLDGRTEPGIGIFVFDCENKYSRGEWRAFSEKGEYLDMVMYWTAFPHPDKKRSAWIAITEQRPNPEYIEYDCIDSDYKMRFSKCVALAWKDKESRKWDYAIGHYEEDYDDSDLFWMLGRDGGNMEINETDYHFVQGILWQPLPKIPKNP